MTYRIIKFTGDTIAVGLISGEDESAYRGELQQLSVNNLVLNIT